MVKTDPQDTVQFKTWLVRKSQQVSEADPEVLADYILALLEIDSTPEEHILNLNEQLSDFTDQSQDFSQQIVKCLLLKEYLNDSREEEDRRKAEVEAKQRILQRLQEKKLAKQREEEQKRQEEEERLALQDQERIEEAQRLQEEKIRLENDQEERQKQFEIKQQKKAEMIDGLTKMIQLKEKMLDEYELKLGELQEILLSNPGDTALAEEVKLKFTIIKDEMITNYVTPEDITNDKIKLEQAANSTSMLSTRAKTSSYRQSRGVTKAGVHKPSHTGRTTTYNKKLDLRTRTLTIGNISQGQIHKILQQLDMDQIETTKSDDESGFNVTFKDRFYAEQIIKRGLVLDGEKVSLRWNEGVRPVQQQSPKHIN